MTIGFMAGVIGVQWRDEEDGEGKLPNR